MGIPFFLLDDILFEPDVGESLRRFFVGDVESIYKALMRCSVADCEVVGWDSIVRVSDDLHDVGREEAIKRM